MQVRTWPIVTDRLVVSIRIIDLRVAESGRKDQKKQAYKGEWPSNCPPNLSQVLRMDSILSVVWRRVLPGNGYGDSLARRASICITKEKSLVTMGGGKKCACEERGKTSIFGLQIASVEWNGPVYARISPRRMRYKSCAPRRRPLVSGFFATLNPHWARW